MQKKLFLVKTHFYWLIHVHQTKLYDPKTLTFRYSDCTVLHCDVLYYIVVQYIAKNFTHLAKVNFVLSLFSPCQR